MPEHGLAGTQAGSALQPRRGLESPALGLPLCLLLFAEEVEYSTTIALNGSHYDDTSTGRDDGVCLRLDRAEPATGCV